MIVIESTPAAAIVEANQFNLRSRESGLRRGPVSSTAETGTTTERNERVANNFQRRCWIFTESEWCG